MWILLRLPKVPHDPNSRHQLKSTAASTSMQQQASAQLFISQCVPYSLMSWSGSNIKLGTRAHHFAAYLNKSKIKVSACRADWLSCCNSTTPSINEILAIDTVNNAFLHPVWLYKEAWFPRLSYIFGEQKSTKICTTAMAYHLRSARSPLQLIIKPLQLISKNSRLLM